MPELERKSEFEDYWNTCSWKGQLENNEKLESPK